MSCVVCKGPFHPASGHVWGNDVSVCGPCIRHFFDWVKEHTHPRRKGPDFYAAAATSIKAKKE